METEVAMNGYRDKCFEKELNGYFVCWLWIVSVRMGEMLSAAGSEDEGKLDLNRMNEIHFFILSFFLSFLTCLNIYIYILILILIFFTF
jgi:hypothetical protein